MRLRNCLSGSRPKSIVYRLRGINIETPLDKEVLIRQNVL